MVVLKSKSTGICTVSSTKVALRPVFLVGLLQKWACSKRFPICLQGLHSSLLYRATLRDGRTLIYRPEALLETLALFQNWPAFLYPKNNFFCGISLQHRPDLLPRSYILYSMSWSRFYLFILFHLCWCLYPHCPPPNLQRTHSFRVGRCKGIQTEEKRRYTVSAKWCF